MGTSSTTRQQRIDELMEQASNDLVAGRYFACERACNKALLQAHALGDFERMARILLPLQEARRQKRDLAFDADKVFLINNEIPAGEDLVPGCYLIAPPRVGADGRSLRESADASEVPVIVVVREPRTQLGYWPIVALGPVTIREQVEPPDGLKPALRGPGADDETRRPVEEWLTDETLPPREWFLHANEQLGDAGIESVPAGSSLIAKIDHLLDRLQAHPDHEKLHQALESACRQAVREGVETVPIEDDDDATLEDLDD